MKSIFTFGEMMHKIILSAPFGNWLDWPNCTSTLGTFTWEYRGGWLYRVWRIIRTVRWYPGIGTWKNKLGLPNPGLTWYVGQTMDQGVGTNYARGKIVSIDGLNSMMQWKGLLTEVSRTQIPPLAIELNLSCPNVGNLQGELFKDNKEGNKNLRELFVYALMNSGIGIIAKLPPVGYERLVEIALESGITAFHCCNTIPLPDGLGGISGKPLKPFSLNCIRWIRKQVYGSNNEKNEGRRFIIIGGGGITGIDDINEYKDAGATHFAIGSELFKFWRWRKIKRMAYDIADYHFN